MAAENNTVVAPRIERIRLSDLPLLTSVDDEQTVYSFEDRRESLDLPDVGPMMQRLQMINGAQKLIVKFIVHPHLNAQKLFVTLQASANCTDCNRGCSRPSRP